jgi:hypothetical protein
MKNLYITNMRKLVKSKLYIAGLIIAVVVTFLFTNNGLNLGGIFDRMTMTERMFFIGAAIVAFFTIYTPLFICEEYTEGSLKNKLIAGFTQKQIYGAGLLTQLSAAGVMWLLYFFSGLLGGGRPDVQRVLEMIIFLLAIIGYVTVIYSLSFRMEKPIRSTIIAFLLLNVNFNMITFGNLMIMISKGVALKIAAVIYNISVLGQWFVHTGLSDEEANPGSVIQIIISVVIFALALLFGTSKINKRDLK